MLEAPDVARWLSLLASGLLFLLISGLSSLSRSQVGRRKVLNVFFGQGGKLDGEAGAKRVRTSQRDLQAQVILVAVIAARFHDCLTGLPGNQVSRVGQCELNRRVSRFRSLKQLNFTWEVWT